MKKVLIFSLLAVFLFCLPALAGDRRTIAETDYMLFKCETFNQARPEDPICIIEVIDKQTDKLITSETYKFNSFGDNGITIGKQLNGRAMRTEMEQIIPVDAENKGNLEIIITDFKTLVLELQGSNKKLTLLEVRE